MRPRVLRDHSPDRPPTRRGRDCERTWLGLRRRLLLLLVKLRDRCLRHAVRRSPRRRLLPQNERRALDILGIEDQAKRDEIRARYKALVKDLHPDLNGGRRDDEERLSHVIWAWEQLKSSRNFAE